MPNSPTAGVVAPSREDPLVADASQAIGGPHGRRSAGHPWWKPVRVILAVMCVVWVLALVQKAPCAAGGWSGSNSRYALMCYSDVPYLYVDRGFAEREVPFTDTGGRYPDLEYPVLIGWFAYDTALVTQALHGWPDLAARAAVEPDAVGSVAGVEDERRAYFVVTAVLLAPFALLAAYFLAGAHRGRPWDAMGFAAAPVLVLTGLVNWDVLAVAAVAGAFFAWSRGRPFLAGVAVGLGAAAKLYPLFLLGAFLIVAWRRKRLSDFGKAVGGAAVAWLAVDVPVMVRDFHAWKGFWSFNAGRGPDWGSLWLVLGDHGHWYSPHTVNLVSWVIFGAVCLGVLLLGLKTPAVPRVAQLAYLIVAGFLIVNKVYSPQYVLWLLPLAVMARPRWRDLLIWQAGEAFYFALIWWHLGGFTDSATVGGQDPVYDLAILVRVVAELYLAAVIVRDMLRPDLDPVRGGLLDHDPMYVVSQPVRTPAKELASP